jgi:hypothetical protein
MKTYIFKLILFVLYFLLSNVTIRAGDEIDLAIKTRLGGFTQDNEDLSWITDDLRRVVEEKLQSEWLRSDYEEKKEIEKKLVSIGHPETLQRLADEMRKGNQWNALRWSATEDAIPYLMEIVESDSSIDPGFGDGDVYVYSARGRAAGLVVEIIRSRIVFPDETRRWASTLDVMSPSPTLEDSIKNLNIWWQKNQKAISEKRFSDATWIPDAGGKDALK